MNKLCCNDPSLSQLAQKLVDFTHQLDWVTDKPNDAIYLELNKSTLNLIVDSLAPFNLEQIYLPLIKRKFSQDFLITTINLPRGSQVFDLTAGLGQDSFILASFGYKVLMVEQHPILATMLYHAIEVGLFPTNNISVICANSLDFLQNTSQVADAIYLDPMFNDNKSAKSKLQIQLIDRLLANDLVSLDSNNTKLFNLAYQYATKKIIVKRDNNAKQLVSSPLPTYSKSGKTVRYDIYVINN